MVQRQGRAARPTGEVIRALEPLDDLAEVFATLGSAPRLRLLFLLYYRPDLSVGELAEILKTSISGVSTHLKRLRQAGLVNCRRDGQTVCCALASNGDHIRALRDAFRRIAQETGCCRS
jgi:DNA-binding transcriptional ArsR family regulator